MTVVDADCAVVIKVDVWRDEIKVGREAVISLDWSRLLNPMDPNWTVDLFRQPLFLSRYGPLDLDWSIGVDSASNPVQSSPTRSLARSAARCRARARRAAREVFV